MLEPVPGALLIVALAWLVSIAVGIGAMELRKYIRWK